MLITLSFVLMGCYNMITDCTHGVISWKYRKGNIQIYECVRCGKYISYIEVIEDIGPNPFKDM